MCWSWKVFPGFLPGNEVTEWLTSESLLGVTLGIWSSYLGNRGHQARGEGRQVCSVSLGYRKRRATSDQSLLAWSQWAANLEQAAPNEAAELGPYSHSQ